VNGVYIGTRLQSEIIPGQPPALDTAHVERAARIHEDGGFDRALVTFHSTSPESILVAGHAASVTTRLGLLIAHRPGFTSPTHAARQLATLDVFTGGRIALHVITGGSDQELRQDGSFIGKEERYDRIDEYLEIVRREWTSTTPFNHPRT
jgi:alkanesulfonate monooxygenase